MYAYTLIVLQIFNIQKEKQRECEDMTEEFIRVFKDKLDWGNISGYQKLSNDFLREFKDKIHWNSFFFREDVQAMLIEKIINKDFIEL